LILERSRNCPFHDIRVTILWINGSSEDLKGDFGENWIGTSPEEDEKQRKTALHPFAHTS
jgi:hypothetical protein